MPPESHWGGSGLGRSGGRCRACEEEVGHSVMNRLIMGLVIGMGQAAFGADGSTPKPRYRLEKLGYASRAVSYDNNFPALGPGPDGRIYGGCYPGSKLIEYDPKTGKCIIKAVLHKQRAYLRNLAATDDGRIWCSLNSPGLLAVYDTRTGKTRQCLPKQFVLASSFMSTILIKGGRVYASLYGAGPEQHKALVFDARSGEFLKPLKQAGHSIPGDYAEGLYQYSPEKLTLSFFHPDQKDWKVVLAGRITRLLRQRSRATRPVVSSSMSTQYDYCWQGWQERSRALYRLAAETAKLPPAPTPPRETTHANDNGRRDSPCRLR